MFVSHTSSAAAATNLPTNPTSLIPNLPVGPAVPNLHTPASPNYEPEADVPFSVPLSPGQEDIKSPSRQPEPDSVHPVLEPVGQPPRVITNLNCLNLPLPVPTTYDQRLSDGSSSPSPPQPAATARCSGLTSGLLPLPQAGYGSEYHHGYPGPFSSASRGRGVKDKQPAVVSGEARYRSRDYLPRTETSTRVSQDHRHRGMTQDHITCARQSIRRDSDREIYQPPPLRLERSEKRSQSNRGLRSPASRGAKSLASNSRRTNSMPQQRAARRDSCGPSRRSEQSRTSEETTSPELTKALAEVARLKRELARAANGKHRVDQPTQQGQERRGRRRKSSDKKEDVQIIGELVEIEDGSDEIICEDDEEVKVVDHKPRSTYLAEKRRRAAMKIGREGRK